MILAFDTSGVSCACAAEENGKTESVFINNGLTHSQTLLPSIDECIKKVGKTVNDIDTVAVVTGPGSFTGVKIAVATAKGLTFGKNIKLASVSALAAYVFSLGIENGLVCPVMDARRNMYYNALFEMKNGVITRLCADRQISADDIKAECGDRFIFCGDCSAFGGEQSYITGEGIIRAVKAGVCEISDSVSAVYLRPPQAERERLERLKNQGSEKKGQ